MINEKNIEKTKILIKNAKKPIIVLAQNDEYNRKISEYGKFDILIGLDSLSRKRSLRNIDSGFNQVLGKIMTKNKIAIGIDLIEINKLNNKNKAERLTQIMQNIKIARKTGTVIKLLNYKDKRDALSLMKSMGCDTRIASKSLDF